MDDYIRAYPNALDKSFCDKLISKFENCVDQQLGTLPKEGRQFTEIPLQSNMEYWKDEFSVCLSAFQGVIENYKDDLSIRSINSNHNQSMSALWPEKYGMEGIKIKRYLDNDRDMFDWHVDVSDGQSNARFLAFFIYLDDNDAGGTEFVDKTIDCVAGTALMFPPMWPWLHRGLKPINKPKYLLQSYLHYLSPEALGEPTQWEIEGVDRFITSGRHKDAAKQIDILLKKYPQNSYLKQKQAEVQAHGK